MRHRSSRPLCYPFFTLLLCTDQVLYSWRVLLGISGVRSALQEATVVDSHLLLGLATSRADRLHGCDDVHALDHLAEHDVAVVQPRGCHRGDEELGAVRVWSCIGHAEHARAGVLQVEVLIWELGSVDALATGAVPTGEVATLDHEVGNDAVERAALEVQRLSCGGLALVARAQMHEVRNCLRHVLAVEADGDALWLGIPNLHVKEHLVCHLRLSCRGQHSQRSQGRNKQRSAEGHLFLRQERLGWQEVTCVI
mmetsp:Transcript_73486/g.118586  ORF Transcript_73486/g.118586 Transcript_73486/m.118586 type:complete len:253 (-) Transcript_73486:21-779(-)